MKKIINQPENYVNEMLEGLYIAHPDLIKFQGDHAVYRKYMRRLCQEAKSCGLPLEMNLLGFWTERNYPDIRFWAHNPETRKVSPRNGKYVPK